MVGFIKNGDCEYAGKHILIDLHGCEYHGSQDEIQSVMIDACERTGATVLRTCLHPFDGGGVSGAVILAESHMSIHTWPERDFVSLDIFVCGNCDPELAVPPLVGFFKPSRSDISMHQRGLVLLDTEPPA